MEGWGMAEQIALWHDCLEDAIGAAIISLGGHKKVAKLLWPVLAETKPETASSRIRNCLNPEKNDKLSPDELLTIMKRAAGAGDHSIMNYLGREALYEVTPVAPADAEKRARVARRKALLAELARLEDEA
jgi:hypothetical protein